MVAGLSRHLIGPRYLATSYRSSHWPAADPAQPSQASPTPSQATHSIQLNGWIEAHQHICAQSVIMAVCAVKNV